MNSVEFNVVCSGSAMLLCHYHHSFAVCPLEHHSNDRIQFKSSFGQHLRNVTLHILEDGEVRSGFCCDETKLVDNAQEVRSELD